jgi:hypothetical protein
VWNSGVPAEWQVLGFAPDNNLILFRLGTYAGGPGDDSSAWVGSGNGEIGWPTTQADFQADHWFFARALGDQDGDGVNSVFWISHMTSGVSYRREVE